MVDQNSEGRPPTDRVTRSETAADQSDAMKGREPMPTEKPSQAEGDRETVDRAIEEHENRGDLD